MEGTGQTSPKTPASSLTAAQATWADREEGEFEELEQAAQTDADAEARAATKPDRWRPIRRTEHNEAVNQYQMDEKEVGFEKEVEAEIVSGEIAVPAGGPLTPEEVHEAEMHPWPGHSMEETVERLRSRRTTDQV